MNILILDDDQISRDMIGNMLNFFGYTTVGFESGFDALDYIQNGDEPVHLIILDLAMPRMSGNEFLYELHHKLKITDIPVMIVTASYIDAPEELMREYGIEHYLMKPFRMADMKEALEAIFE